MPPKVKISDKATHDSGGNFGRVARVHGLMSDWTERMLQTRVSGVEAGHWVNFFKAYADSRGREEVEEKLDRLLGAQMRVRAQSDTAELLSLLGSLHSDDT